MRLDGQLLQIHCHVATNLLDERERGLASDAVLEAIDDWARAKEKKVEKKGRRTEGQRDRETRWTESMRARKIQMSFSAPNRNHRNSR